MLRCLLSLTLLLVGPSLAWSQREASADTSADDKGTYLGVLFAPVPDVVYAQLPQLERARGVVVSYVLPDSPAAKAGLRRNDILLQYDDHKVRDCEQLALLIRDDTPNRSVRLKYLRAGKEETAEATLIKGPILRIAQKGAGNADSEPRGTVKAGNPDAVDIAATPLGGDRMKLSIDYFDAKSGRYRTFLCTGTLDEIEKQLADLPDQEVQKLVKTALKRLREPVARKNN